MSTSGLLNKRRYILFLRTEFREVYRHTDSFQEHNESVYFLKRSHYRARSQRRSGRSLGLCRCSTEIGTARNIRCGQKMNNNNSPIVIAAKSLVHDL